MELSTDVSRFSRQSRIHVWFNNNENLEELAGADERLRVILVQKGTGIVRVDGRRLAIIAPAILCINEKEEVQMEAKQNWAAQAVYFHPCYINSDLNFDKIRETDITESITNRQDIFLFRPFVRKDKTYAGLLEVDHMMMKKISELFGCARGEIEEQSHRIWSCSTRAYILELLFTLVKVYETPESKACAFVESPSALASDVMMYLSSNYEKKITISQLCAMFNTNKTTLQKEFKHATSQSVMAYLIALRVRLAALMLKDTSIMISNIAERLGFSDSTHFNKAFHKLTGYSPVQYRKEFRGIREKLPI